MAAAVVAAPSVPGSSPPLSRAGTGTFQPITPMAMVASPVAVISRRVISASAGLPQTPARSPALLRRMGTFPLPQTPVAVQSPVAAASSSFSRTISGQSPVLFRGNTVGLVSPTAATAVVSLPPRLVVVPATGSHQLRPRPRDLSFHINSGTSTPAITNSEAGEVEETESITKQEPIAAKKRWADTDSEDDEEPVQRPGYRRMESWTASPDDEKIKAAGKAPRIGIDIGGVLTRDGDPNSAFTHKTQWQYDPDWEAPGAFDAVWRIVRVFGEDNTFLVSKVSPGGSMHSCMEEWLHNTCKFCEATGLKKENIVFVEKKDGLKGKGVAAMHLGLSHFVDDKIEVLVSLAQDQEGNSSAHIQRFQGILFHFAKGGNGQVRPPNCSEELAPNLRSHYQPVANWAEVLETLKEKLPPKLKSEQNLRLLDLKAKSGYESQKIPPKVRPVAPWARPRPAPEPRTLTAAETSSKSDEVFEVPSPAPAVDRPRASDGRPLYVVKPRSNASGAIREAVAVPPAPAVAAGDAPSVASPAVVPTAPLQAANQQQQQTLNQTQGMMDQPQGVMNPQPMMSQPQGMMNQQMMNPQQMMNQQQGMNQQQVMMNQQQMMSQQQAMMNQQMMSQQQAMMNQQMMGQQQMVMVVNTPQGMMYAPQGVMQPQQVGIVQQVMGPQGQMMMAQQPVMMGQQPMGAMMPQQSMQGSMMPQQAMMVQQQPMMVQQQPMMSQQQPMMGQHQPMMVQQQSVMGQQQPVMGQQQNMMGQHQPMMGQQQPMMGQQQPMMAQQQPMMGQGVMMAQPMMGGQPVMYMAVQVVPATAQQTMTTGPCEVTPQQREDASSRVVPPSWKLKKEAQSPMSSPTAGRSFPAPRAASPTHSVSQPTAVRVASPPPAAIVAAGPRSAGAAVQQDNRDPVTGRPRLQLKPRTKPKDA